MPEDFRLADYHNLALKRLQYIPWPIRNRVAADTGVVLLDPVRFYEFEKFTPASPVDVYGSTTDVDGIPYVEKLRGEVAWVAPSRTVFMDHGYFLLDTRRGGMPTLANKLASKARVYYHRGGWVGPGKLPHEAGMRAIVEASMARIVEKYGPIEWRFTSAEDFGKAQRSVRELLDSGVETLLIAPAAPIYSHHEEFNGAFRHAMRYVHDWEHEHGKRIKVIFTRQLGDFEVLREAYLAMLRERLDTLPPHAAVKVAVSIHGMAWNRVPHEAWLELAPKYRDGMVADARKLLERYPFRRKEVVLSQDWSEPYTREFVIEGTHIIYNGLPVGRFNEPIVQAHVQAIDEVLSRRERTQGTR